MQIGLSPLQSGGNFAETIRECERGEALGLDSVWLGEHHNRFRWPHPVVKPLPGKLTIERLAEDRFILGTPEQCIAQIQRFRQELGLTHLVCRSSFPGVPREVSLASLERFGREVLPALR
jgi:alkanesulfonate monooxygenase SsuD/methylene tetrahydromethanopterin reductase-like flavin-dependent oxidoreductase (luciferase family)